ncbi:hypothetical protein [Nonomuraea fuscirosea]|uniref:hypothetical protein n=1 Tax=Nonomuraea fuscirosea TaxID=1291556 RepID=UPI0033CF4474
MRDICPGDNLPVRARVAWRHTDGANGHNAWKWDRNGCGDNGTGFGNITRTGSKSIMRVYLEVQVQWRPGQWLHKISKRRYNQYTR